MLAGRPQRHVNFHGALKASRVVVPQPAPFLVGAVGTEHARRARHFMGNAKGFQPLLAHGAGDLAFNQRKHRRRPGNFREPQPHTRRASGFIEADAEVLLDMNFITRKPLARFQADDFMADGLFNDIQLCIPWCIDGGSSLWVNPVRPWYRRGCWQNAGRSNSVRVSNPRRACRWNAPGCAGRSSDCSHSRCR